MTYAFYLIFALYFVGSVLLATRYVMQAYGERSATVVAGSYATLGVGFGWLLVKSIRVSTTTTGETVATEAKQSPLPRDP